jgi:hypothetical protein
MTPIFSLRLTRLYSYSLVAPSDSEFETPVIDLLEIGRSSHLKTCLTRSCQPKRRISIIDFERIKNGKKRFDFFKDDFQRNSMEEK